MFNNTSDSEKKKTYGGKSGALNILKDNVRERCPNVKFDVPLGEMNNLLKGWLNVMDFIVHLRSIVPHQASVAGEKEPYYKNWNSLTGEYEKEGGWNKNEYVNFMGERVGTNLSPFRTWGHITEYCRNLLNTVFMQGAQCIVVCMDLAEMIPYAKSIEQEKRSRQNVKDVAVKRAEEIDLTEKFRDFHFDYNEPIPANYSEAMEDRFGARKSMIRGVILSLLGVAPGQWDPILGEEEGSRLYSPPPGCSLILDGHCIRTPEQLRSVITRKGDLDRWNGECQLDPCQYSFYPLHLYTPPQKDVTGEVPKTQVMIRFDLMNTLGEGDAKLYYFAQKLGKRKTVVFESVDSDIQFNCLQWVDRIRNTHPDPESVLPSRILVNTNSCKLEYSHYGRSSSFSYRSSSGKPKFLVDMYPFYDGIRQMMIPSADVVNQWEYVPATDSCVSAVVFILMFLGNDYVDKIPKITHRHVMNAMLEYPRLFYSWFHSLKDERSKYHLGSLLCTDDRTYWLPQKMIPPCERMPPEVKDLAQLTPKNTIWQDMVLNVIDVVPERLYMFYLVMCYFAKRTRTPSMKDTALMTIEELCKNGGNDLVHFLGAYCDKSMALVLSYYSAQYYSSLVAQYGNARLYEPDPYHFHYITKSGHEEYVTRTNLSKPHVM